MRMMSRCLLYVLSGLSLLFSSVGFAAVSPMEYAQCVARAQGAYGAEMASFHAEMAYAANQPEDEVASTSSLLRDGNGYVQARADQTVGQGVGSQVELT